MDLQQRELNEAGEDIHEVARQYLDDFETREDLGEAIMIMMRGSVLAGMFGLVDHLVAGVPLERGETVEGRMAVVNEAIRRLQNFDAEGGER